HTRWPRDWSSDVCSSDLYETAKILLEHGADPLVRQSKGFTPMHEAALLGRADLIELLLAHGAEINSMADNGHTPMAEAIRGHHRSEERRVGKERRAQVGR